MMRIINVEPRSRRAIQGATAAAACGAGFTRSLATGSSTRAGNCDSAQRRYAPGAEQFEADVALSGVLVAQCQRLTRADHSLELDRLERAALR